MKLARAFLDDVRSLIASARASVARGVDLVQVHTSFEIGRRIVEQEQKGKSRAGYGEAIIKALAERLTAEFGRGFSERNLAYMRTFYQVYQERTPILQSPIAKSDGRPILQSPTAKSGAGPILQTPSAKSASSEPTVPTSLPIAQSPTGQFGTDAEPTPFRLGWTHYLFLLGIKNPDERSFYEIEAAAQGWTVKELRRQFDSSLYERLALSRDKAGIRDLARRGQVVAGVHDLLKEPLVLEFLGWTSGPGTPSPTWSRPSLTRSSGSCSSSARGSCSRAGSGGSRSTTSTTSWTSCSTTVCSAATS